MISSRPFGMTQSGEAVEAYILTNARGTTAEVLTFGGVLRRLLVPDAGGTLADVVLGFDDLADYEAPGPYFGAVVGRFANRIGGARFEIDGEIHHVTVNDGRNHLHGGRRGYDKCVWRAEVRGDSLHLTWHDPAGTEGFPGNVDVTTIYTLTEDDVLRIEFLAETDAPTPINLTNHAYFNLRDGGATSMEDHVLKIDAERYLPTDSESIPTGEIAPVEGTPLDFRVAKAIGRDIAEGYNHCFVLEPEGWKRAATVFEPTTGRRMEVWTSQPGVQLYTADFLGEIEGKAGVRYHNRHGFCLETQTYPDAPNHEDWPLSVTRPGTPYRQVTEFRFSGA